jgi:hypothetical protein
MSKDQPEELIIPIIQRVMPNVIAHDLLQGVAPMMPPYGIAAAKIIATMPPYGIAAAKIIATKFFHKKTSPPLSKGEVLQSWGLVCWWCRWGGCVKQSTE